MTGCDPRRSQCLFSFVSKLILPIAHHSFSHGLHLRAHGGDHICFIRVHLECRFAAIAQLTFNSSSKIKTLHSHGFDPRRTSPVRGGSAAQARPSDRFASAPPCVKPLVSRAPC